MSFCNKYVAFSLNFIYFIIGGIVVGLGIWVLIDLPDFTKFFAYGTLIGGGAVILTSCLGFSGTTSTNKNLLVLYLMSLAAVIALQSYVIYECFTLNPTTIEEAVYEGLDNSFKNGRKKVYHNLEKTIKCCGVNKTEGGDYQVGHLPKLCCKEDPQGNSCKPHLSTYNQEPNSTTTWITYNQVWPSCTKVLTDHIVEYARPFAYGMLGSCMIQILMIVSACILITYRRSYKGHSHISY